MSSAEFFAAMLVISGWAATHLFSEARERRKEIRSSLDKLLIQIHDTEKMAIDFHMSVSFSESNRFVIQGKIARIERQLNRLTALNSDAFISCIVSFRRSITLRNFDPSNFQAQLSNSVVLYEIFGACSDLEDEIEFQYNQKYPAKFPYIKFHY